MNSATISADIISYTSLVDTDKRKLESQIRVLLSDLSKTYKKDFFFGRIVQGDYIECAVKKPKHILRIALLLKTFIKSLELKASDTKDSRIKYFNEHAIRLAIAVAPLATINAEKGIIDGEAIYLSGRAIKNISTSDKQKIVIKNTLFFCSEIKKEQDKYETIISLLDTIISKCSSKQCEVIYLKLMGYSEKEISEKLGKFQSTISQHSTSAGWHSIEKTVNYFEQNISS